MPASQAGFGKVVVVGQGYVGLPLAMRAVDVGWTVVGLDVDEHRVKRLNAGESYVEDVPSAQLAAAIESGRYQASVEPAACVDFDVAVITVPTPLRDGAPDLCFIEEGAATVARYLRPGRHRRARVHHLPRHHRGAGRLPSWRRARASPPASTSTSATAPSASTPATAPTAWSPRPRSSRASTPPRWRR